MAAQALKEQLERERDYLRDEINVTMHFGEIIGESRSLKRTLARVEAVAPTPANVLVLGESGVGKEMIARAIHGRSHRASKPLVKRWHPTSSTSPAATSAAPACWGEDGAAQLLGLKTSTLTYRLKTFGIERAAVVGATAGREPSA